MSHVVSVCGVVLEERSAPPVTSGYFGDFGHYDGHVVTVQLSTGKTRVFNSLCSDIHELLGASGGQSCPQTKSGIWGRGGAVVDPDPSMHGRIYVAPGTVRSRPTTADMITAIP